MCNLRRYPRGVYNIVMKKDLQSRAVHRTKIIKGQLEGLEKQINQEAYCMDILTQSLAIQKSLASLSKLILENHLRTHIKDNFSSSEPERQEAAIQELISLYELTKVRTNN